MLDGKADKIHTNSRFFLQHPHLTENIKYLLRWDLSRLSGRGGQPVLVLNNEFRGEKPSKVVALEAIKERDNDLTARNPRKNLVLIYVKPEELVENILKKDKF